MLSPAHAPTQVRPPGTHRVAQVFASALPVAYSHVGFADWEPFARLVLRASYEATLAMAACRSVQHASGQRVTVYLTALGGGTFQQPDGASGTMRIKGGAAWLPATGCKCGSRSTTA